MEALQVQTIDKGLSFKVIKGSNYKIVDSFQKEYVIGYDEFLRVSKAIFKDGVDFVTVGDRIINSKYVYLIEPTKEKTFAEKEIIKQKEEAEKQKEARKYELLGVKKAFDLKYWDNVYGKNKWKAYRGFGSKFDKNIHILDKQDFKDCQEAFMKEHPELLNENKNRQSESKTK